MQTIAGFTIYETVSERRGVLTSRARRGDRAVFVRHTAREDPSANEVARLLYGAETARSLALSGVVRINEVQHERGNVVVGMEDFGGQELRRLIDAGPMDLELALSIAVRLSKVLGEIHSAGIVHNDIEPSSIWVNTQTGEVKITNFDLASRLRRESSVAASPGRLEGNLAYLSPERTGRMNRAIDYRSDLYSLGVVLYEMLTGRLPHDARDPMTLVYSHITVTPPPPHEIRPSVAAGLSQTVMKLLAKNAEDRYQSTYGLSVDLEACRGGGPPDGFTPGASDVSANFH